MPLEPGSSIGPYSTTAKIGEGGMSEVYRARDTKLYRDVALKVPPPAFTDDPDRLARFEREAKVLASLNHPGIAQIHGLEEQDGTKALVLELVEGPTLADRIAHGPIPVDEALPIAKQIAGALEAAHEQGFIHRLRFVGHFSSTGPPGLNQRLSEARAGNHYRLAWRLGVSRDRLFDARRPPGRVEDEPTASRDTVHGRSFNRRVELFLIRGGTS